MAYISRPLSRLVADSVILTHSISPFAHGIRYGCCCSNTSFISGGSNGEIHVSYWAVNASVPSGGAIGLFARTSLMNAPMIFLAFLKLL